MEKIELAKKAIKSIGEESFYITESATTGGKCDDGWCEGNDLNLNEKELRYLIKQRINHDELFDGLELKEINIEEIIIDMTQEDAWPDGGPTASLKDIIPEELKEIFHELESIDESDGDAVAAIRAKLSQIKGGPYTFVFDIVNGGRDYYFAENVKKPIELTASEALGLLYGKSNCKEVFNGICDNVIDEYHIENKADELNFAPDYDYFSYGGECEELDQYLDAWEYIINGIFAGSITEDNIDDWMEYFSDSDNYEEGIEGWFEYHNED